MHTLFKALLTLALASNASAAVPVFVSKSINLDATQADTIGAVCAERYARGAGVSVLAPSDAAVALKATGSAQSAAQSLQASEYVELTLVNLAMTGPGRLLVSAARHRADGSLVYEVDASAESLEDVMTACERIATSLTRQVPYADTATRKNITAAEARTSRMAKRIGNEKVIGLKAGFGAPLTFEGSNPMGQLGFDARFEGDRYFIEFGAGLFLVPYVGSGISYGGISAEIGASYYLTEGDVAPYVGAGLQPRLVFSGSYINLAPYAQVGLMLFRQSSTRIYVDARVSQNVLPVAMPYTGTVTSSGAYPTELVAQVGIGW